LVDQDGCMAWADPHCHLYDERIRPLSTALFNADTMGVTRMITVGCDEATSQAAVNDTAEARGLGYDVWATVGLHPHEATHGTGFLRNWLIDDNISTHNIVAVGECGLDYYYEHSPRDVQMVAFAEQIQLAHEFNLPLVIHTRDAWEDTFTVMRSEGVPTSTIFHCFTGGPAEAESCLALADGVALSFSGIITFPSAGSLREAAVITPLDRLTVETDSPYLAPIPMRGKTNVPAYVPHVGAKLAEVKGVDISVIEDATWANVARIFRLSVDSES
jgi:TatD DNase family protein